MPDYESLTLESSHRTPWNKGKLIGAKPPLRPKHVWAIRTRLMRDAGKKLKAKGSHLANQTRSASNHLITDPMKGL